MRRSVGIATLALATVSCGAGGSSGATTGQAAPAAPSDAAPVAAGSYESVRDMQLDVEAAFYLCTAPMKIYDPPISEGALAQADCSDDVTLLIYEPGDVQTGAAALQAEADGALALLVGDNWIISCSSDEDTCERIQGVTGGELMITTP